MLVIWQFTIFLDTASHNSFLSTVTGWQQHKSENRELLKKSKARMHVVRKGLIPSPKRKQTLRHPLRSKHVVKKGLISKQKREHPSLIRQTKKREHPSLIRQTKSCIDQMEIGRTWNYGMKVTDLPVTVGNEIAQTGTSEIMIKCNWLKCHSSKRWG